MGGANEGSRSVTWHYNTGAHSATGDSARLDLPTHEQDEAIRAWKVAKLIVSNGRLMFMPLAHGWPYGIETVAHCDSSRNYPWSSNPLPPHVVPEASCSCGLYALKDRDEAERDSHQRVLLEVELYGSVVVHESGYRAEKQRVLCVWVPRRCASWLCAKDATVLAATKGSATIYASYRSTTVTDLVLPLCDEHAAMTDYDVMHTPASLSDVAALLGTEVRWLA